MPALRNAAGQLGEPDAAAAAGLCLGNLRLDDVTKRIVAAGIKDKNAYRLSPTHIGDNIVKFDQAPQTGSALLASVGIR